MIFCARIYSSILGMLTKRFNSHLLLYLPPLLDEHHTHKSWYSGRRNGWCLKYVILFAQHCNWIKYYKAGGGGGFNRRVGLVINPISILEGKVGGGKINYYYGVCCLFGSRPLHLSGRVGGIQGFLHAWVFTKVTLNRTIMIWHMGSQQDLIPELKLLQPYHFSQMPRFQERFSYLRNLQNTINKVA